MKRASLLIALVLVVAIIIGYLVTKSAPAAGNTGIVPPGIGGSAPNPAPSTQPAPSPAPSPVGPPTYAWDDLTKQCAAWSDQYGLVPFKTWGSTPGNIQTEWDAKKCNWKMCQVWKDRYGVVPYKSWGTMPENLQASWADPNMMCFA